MAARSTLHDSSRSGLAAVALALLASLALQGCVVAPVQPYPGPAGGPAVQGGVVVAPMAPPALVVEPVVVAPAPGYIWIGGYWSWVGGRHVWERGHWVAPRPGYRWVPRQWVQGPGGWHQHGGHWAR